MNQMIESTHRDRRPSTELSPAARALARQWMRERRTWTAGELCDYLIGMDVVQTRRGLLIEAFHAVDALHRQMVEAGELKQIPAEHVLLYGWASRHD